MGILDSLQADDTTKDEFGQTQADRRQPIWSGLIKAGLLGVAAGGDLMPSERAKMVAQMGGAIGDIPKEMMDYRSGAAQQTLRGQQVATAKTKLDNIAKLQALAKTPEFLNSIKDLKPHEKIAMQAAIDAGDIDAFAKITGQVGTGAYKDQQLDIARQRQLTAEERLQLEKDKQAGKAGTYQGTGIEAQHLNNLKNADPSSFEYSSAYNYFSTPRVLSDGTKIDKQTLTGLPEPTYKDPRVAPAKEGEPVTPDKAAQALQPGEKKMLENGVAIYKDQSGTVYVDYPSDGGKEGRRTVQEPNKPVTTIAPTKIDPTDARELNKMKTTQVQAKAAGEDFLNEWKKASTTDRARAMAGLSSPLTAAWTNVALRMKESGIFNLGVITGPDLGLLQRVIADPSSMKSLGVSEAEVEQMLKKVLDIQEIGIREHEKNLMYPPRAGQTPKQPAAGPKRKVKQFNQQTGKMEEVEVD